MKAEIKVIMAICFALMIFGIIKYQNRPYENRQIEYIVQNGETLWEIAEKNKQNYQDTRKYVFYIQKDNDIKTYIYSGQKLILR